MRALLEGQRDESLAALHRAQDAVTDPEARYYVARSFARLTEPDAALVSLRAAIDGGYFCYPALEGDPWLDSVRGAPAFAAVLDTARARHESTVLAFTEADGQPLLSERGTP